MSDTQKYKFASKEAYEQFLDQYAGDDYIAERDLGRGQKAKYMPVVFQESLADMAFSEWGPINEDYNVIMNEIICTVKLTYIPDYPGAQERFITGSASTAIQQDSGVAASSFPQGKKKNALEYCLPKVRKQAISNALESIGNIFGRNVGRKTQLGIIDPDFSFRKSVEEGGEDA